jgi:hypothetical protein
MKFHRTKVLYLGSMRSMSTGAARTGEIGDALGVWPPHRGTEEPLPQEELALTDGRSLPPLVVDGEGPVKRLELSGSA